MSDTINDILKENIREKAAKGGKTSSLMAELKIDLVESIAEIGMKHEVTPAMLAMALGTVVGVFPLTDQLVFAASFKSTSERVRKLEEAGIG